MRKKQVEEKNIKVRKQAFERFSFLASHYNLKYYEIQNIFSMISNDEFRELYVKYMHYKIDEVAE